MNESNDLHHGQLPVQAPAQNDERDRQERDAHTTPELWPSRDRVLREQNEREHHKHGGDDARLEMLCRPDAAPQWLGRWRRRKAECIGQRIVHSDDGACLASARSWPCRHDFHAERLGRIDRLRQPEQAHLLHLWRTFSCELLHENVIARQRHMPRFALHDREPVETARLLPRRATMRMETRRNHDQRSLARTKRTHGLRENLLAQKIPPDRGRIDKAGIDIEKCAFARHHGHLRT